MSVLYLTQTGRTATCVCGLPLSEWVDGAYSTWHHDGAADRPDLCPGWREAAPVEGSIHAAGETRLVRDTANCCSDGCIESPADCIAEWVTR